MLHLAVTFNSVACVLAELVPTRTSNTPGSTTRFMGDEHLGVFVPEGKAAPALAEQVVLTPPHCDPTVNLYESYHVVKGDTLVDIWPVTARGRSR